VTIVYSIQVFVFVLYCVIFEHMILVIYIGMHFDDEKCAIEISLVFPCFCEFDLWRLVTCLNCEWNCM
jgi:hypothetical protein